MVRKISRVYELSDREVNEAILAHLRIKDMPVPQYVGDTPTVKWIKQPNGIRIEWTEEGELDV
jgi:hypothetical protein